MKIISTDAELILTGEELSSIQAAHDVLTRIKHGFNVIDTETIAGFDKDDYANVATFLDDVFRRSHLER